VNGFIALVADTAGMTTLASTFVANFMVNFPADVMPTKYRSRVKVFTSEAELDTFV